MQRFAELLEGLVFQPSRNGKLRLIETYFRETPDPDRGHGLAGLTGSLVFTQAKPALIRGLVEARVDRLADRTVLQDLERDLAFEGFALGLQLGILAEARVVLRYSSELDPRDGVVVDVGPGARGGSTLGTNDGRGHARNPATGRPYRPNRMLRGDFGRALAEFWADGPDSETPPGHWNTIANTVSDAVAEGDRLEWDVKLYFALNGALHDAAVAAWGAKREYESARPISMIRWLAAEGKLPKRVRALRKMRSSTGFFWRL